MVRNVARDARRARREQQRRTRKTALRAERRGRLVPPTLAGYREAVANDGADALAGALIARHHRRLERLDEVASLTQVAALPTLTGYFQFDAALRRLQPGRIRLPVSMGTNWLDELGWGLDSVAAATRLAMCLQVVGATVIARTQLERWSTNLGDNIGADQQPGEDTGEWMNRIWSTPGAQRIHVCYRGDSPQPGRTVHLRRQLEAGSCFVEMSELMHGRGRLTELVWWESVEFEEPLSVELRHLDALTDALVLSVHRIALGLATAASQIGDLETATRLRTTAIVGPASAQLRPLVPYLRPLEMPLVASEQNMIEFAMAGGHYDRGVQQSLDGVPPDFPAEGAPALAFAERRGRAFMLARAALQHERERFGESVNDASLMRVSIEAIFAVEMAALLARWLCDRGDTSAPTSFALCSSALRSATWLWLEDDERSMGCLRALIEHIARLRTLRTKPSAAAKLDARPETTPRDWIEACGWRRLGILLRALGEYAHGAEPAHWDGAAGALVALNRNPDRTLAEQTGRTNALIDLIAMLDGECAAWLGLVDAAVAAAFWQIIRLTPDQVERGIEARLQHAWLNRAHVIRSAATDP